MSQIDDFLRMLDEQDYSEALKKERQRKQIKKQTAEPAKTEDELLQEEVVKTKRRKKAKELTTPPPTKQEVLAKKVKEMKTQDDYNELIGKGKPEKGADAVDRLLEAIKNQRNLMYDADGEPVFSGKMEEKTTMSRRRSIPIPGTERVIPIPGSKEFEVDTPGFDPKGKKGSNFRIAQERMDELQEDLRLAQLAKEQGITFQEAKRNKQIEDKYNEYLKQFSINTKANSEYPVKIPEKIVDGNPVGSREIGELPEETRKRLEKRRRELARYTTNKFFSK